MLLIKSQALDQLVMLAHNMCDKPFFLHSPQCVQTSISITNFCFFLWKICQFYKSFFLILKHWPLSQTALPTSTLTEDRGTCPQSPLVQRPPSCPNDSSRSDGTKMRMEAPQGTLYSGGSRAHLGRSREKVEGQDVISQQV